LYRLCCLRGAMLLRLETIRKLLWNVWRLHHHYGGSPVCTWIS
jgi:hypothetical protein